MNLENSQKNGSNLIFRIAVLARRWRQIIDSELQSSGLTDATWRPLLHLHLLGDGLHQKDLSESLGIKGSTLVSRVDLLLYKGLIRRKADHKDRRANLLNLTPKGKKIVDRIQGAVMSLENELFNSLNDDEIYQFAEFVERLEATERHARKRIHK